MSELRSRTFILPISTSNYEEHYLEELIVAIVRVILTNDESIYDSAINTILSDSAESDLKAYEEKLLREECRIVKERLLPQIRNMFTQEELNDCRELMKGKDYSIHVEIETSYRLIVSITEYPS